MELLSVQRARSVWLFDLNDLNPTGKSIGTEFIKWLSESYKFGKVPSSGLDLDKETNALTFLGGSFKVKDEFIIIELRMYNDGAVVDTRSSTDDSDAFIKEALDAAVKKFSLSFRPEMVRRIIYLSEVNVQFERDLRELNPKLKAISAKISSLSGLPKQHAFDVLGLYFWHDPQIQSQIAQFRLERRANRAESANEYYSVAPLKTADHLSVLRELEQIL